MTFKEHLSSRTRDQPYGWTDHEEEIFTVLLWNLSGQLIGYQQYNWLSDKKKRNDRKGRYWTYITKQFKSTSIAVAGLDLVDTSQPLYLVEGMFEMLAAHSVGINAIAVLTNNPKHLTNWLFTYPHKVIALCQDDDAGRKLKNIADSHVFLEKDLDEYSTAELNKLIVDNDINAL